MSALLDLLRRTSNFFARSAAPVDTEGDAVPHPGILASSVTELEDMLRAGTAISPSDLPAYIDAIKNMNGVGLDDRKFLLEKVLTLMSRMGQDNDMSLKMQHFFIDMLYKDLPHPPASFLSPMTGNLANPPTKRDYIFRSSDGSNYNPSYPTLGQAGQPYARSVPTSNLLPASALPDPGLIFDLLLKRDENTFTPHPGGLNSMFFAIANLVIHSIFDTNRQDWKINDTSSYIDLSPLYGNPVSKMKRKTEELRRMDGTGRIWDDCFADERLLFMPPATAAVLVLLSRNHNYIASHLLAINERGTFSPPSSLPSDTARAAQDDELFHRARLVNSGYFARIVLYDYVGGILGMTRDGSAFRLNLVETMREAGHDLAPTGQGNQISAEFNLLYRWHASTSAPDEKWIDGVFQKILQGKPYNQVTPQDFARAAGGFMRAPADIKEWTFGGLTRDTNGRFRDEDLANIIINATEAPAHAFGARRTPEALRVVEIMTIMQGREWGVCTLNEFRKFFGLKPYANFREWNPNPEIYNAAQALYNNIDDLELHVGLQAEETKPPMPGAGLCPSYTMSRAILADAVVLCRSDPYLTTDFNPFNCTSWGYQDCIVNPDDGSFGGMLTKLMFRHLPGQYATGSAYAHFPLVLPKAMKSAMTARNDPAINKYFWGRPTSSHSAIRVNAVGVTDSLAKLDDSSSGYDHRVVALVKGSIINRPLINKALLLEMDNHKWDEEFGQITTQLIQQNSVTRPGFNSKQVDVVQAVLTIVPVYFLANEILGLPLKTDANPRGVYRPEGLYEMFANVGNYVLFHQDPSQEWSMREKATHCATTVVSEITANIDRLSHGVFSFAGLTDTVADSFSAKNDKSSQFLRSVLERAKLQNVSRDDLAASLFAEVVPTAAQYSAAVAHIVDFYLDDEQAKERAEICRLSASNVSSDDAQLLSYAQTALRHNPSLSISGPGQEGSSAVSSKSTNGAGRAAASSATALNSAASSAQSFTKLNGSEDDVIPGTAGLMASRMFEKTAPSVLRAIFSLKNIRRAPGMSGQLPKFEQEVSGTQQTLYINNQSGISPWPTGLVLQYDV